jgi:hypothetical protein
MSVFATSQKVVVVLRELPALIATLDGLGLSLKMTSNEGVVAAQNCYARGDVTTVVPLSKTDCASKYSAISES